MSKLVIKDFLMEGQPFQFVHELKDDSRQVISVEDDSMVLRFDSGRRVTDRNNNRIARAVIGAAETWDFIEDATGERFCTGYRSNEKAELLFTKYLWEKNRGNI